MASRKVGMMGYSNGLDSYSQTVPNSELNQIFSVLGGFFACFTVLYLAAVIFQIWLYYRVFFRAGYSGWMGLLSFIPGVGPLVCLLVLAFDTWPRDRKPFVPATQMPIYKPPVAPVAPTPTVEEPVVEPIVEPVTAPTPTVEEPTEPVAPIPPKEG
ncbi:MAG: hypothetical protein JJE36_04195 [Coriobacteriia bacterium]|nr:hypothetical protein [Coriobacteriia bacterium]